MFATFCSATKGLCIRWYQNPSASLRYVRGGPIFISIAAQPASIREDKMAWKTPKIVEVSVGMEINMYACAARK
jgi:coenzyme PQQ precursor peptide PqqA